MHVNKSTSCLAEAQAADAKRILDRERQALRLAKQTATEQAASPRDHDGPLQASQQPQASLLALMRRMPTTRTAQSCHNPTQVCSAPLQAVLHDHKQHSRPPSGSHQQKSRQLSPACPGQKQTQPGQSEQVKPSSSSAHTAQSQPDQLGSYGLPIQAATARPAHRFDDATDLASFPAHHQGMFTVAQGQQSPVQPQFMSGLMALHGMTTPEEKRKREEKQKQYAHELDEQVPWLPLCADSVASAGVLFPAIYTWHLGVLKLPHSPDHL